MGSPIKDKPSQSKTKSLDPGQRKSQKLQSPAQVGPTTATPSISVPKTKHASSVLAQGM
jgi:hypothetical protein